MGALQRAVQYLRKTDFQKNPLCDFLFWNALENIDSPSLIKLKENTC